MSNPYWNKEVCVVENDTNTEDYNQIDTTLLDRITGPSYPVDFFAFNESAGILKRVYRAGSNISTAKRESFRRLSEEGLLFFTRNQIDQYVSMVADDHDSALDDPNLTWANKAPLFVNELKKVQDAVYEQPMPRELEALRKALHILCTHLQEKPDRMNILVNKIHQEITPEKRRVNASLLALTVYLQLHKHDILDEIVESVALGFFLYDIGMTKVSHLMIGQNRKLNPQEQKTVQSHPKKSLEILNRMGLNRPEIVEPAIQHHERLNGKGYPNSLPANRIGPLGRIVAATDTYCAMITDTAHRKGFPPIEAAAELIRNEASYDQTVSRTLITYLQTVPS